MAKKSTSSTADAVSTSTTDSVATLDEQVAPTNTESETETPKSYSLDLDLRFTDKETGEVKFISNLKYSMPIDKISATGSKRTEYKIFIDGIFFGRTSKYWGPKMFLKTKSQKEFQFADGAELKQFCIKRASEFGAVKADLEHDEYSALIQTYGLTEEDLAKPLEKPATKSATLQQQTLFV